MTRKWLPILKAWLPVAGPLLVCLVLLPAFGSLERRVDDLRLRLRHDGGWPDDLVLVPIDDAAMNEVGMWPWPREQQAALLRGLEDLGVKTVFLDLVHSTPGQPEADAALARAMKNVILPIAPAKGGATSGGRVALEKAFLPTAGDPSLTLPSSQLLLPRDVFAEGALGVGHIIHVDNNEGKVRGHIPLLSVSGKKQGIPSTALLALLKHRGLDPKEVRYEPATFVRPARMHLPTGKTFSLTRGEIRLDFVPVGKNVAQGKIQRYGGPDGLPVVPALRVLKGEDLSAALGGKLAIVYLDSIYTPDNVDTPITINMTGGLIHAWAIRTLDSGRTPWTLPIFWVVAALAIVASTVTAPFLTRPPSVALQAAGVAILFLAAASVLGMMFLDVFVPVVFPFFFLAGWAGSIGFVASRNLERDRRQLRNLLVKARSQSASLPVQRVNPDEPTIRKDAPEKLTNVPTVDSAKMSGSQNSVSGYSRSRDSSVLLLGGTTLDEEVELGRYLVKRTLGRGGMGAIFLAIDRDLDRPVAIKILEKSDEAAFARFRREALAVARISHPNVVQIYEVGLDAQVPFIVMEYVGGGTLGDMLRDPDVPLPLDWQHASRIILGSARGLGAAHLKQIVHRDVKPANILMEKRNGDMAKVADFGIAKLAGTESLTREGSFLGTVGYLSPEQAMGKPVDARSDVYSLAVTWYRMVTGRRAFEGTTAQVLRASATEPVPDPRRDNPTLPDAVAELLMRMGEVDPTRRPKDCNVVAAALETILPEKTTVNRAVVRP